MIKSLTLFRSFVSEQRENMGINLPPFFRARRSLSLKCNDVVKLCIMLLGGSAAGEGKDKDKKRYELNKARIKGLLNDLAEVLR
jgi:hypothetical protein